MDSLDFDASGQTTIEPQVIDAAGIHFEGAAGHSDVDTPIPVAGSATLKDVSGQRQVAPHARHASNVPFTVEGLGHAPIASQDTDARAIDQSCNNLRELHRQRQDMHRAEKSMTLRIKAICRRLCDGDKTEADKVYKAMTGKTEHDLSMNAIAISAPFIYCRGHLKEQRTAIEKRMASEAKSLPVAEWIENTRGIGIGSLAAIVGEAGNLSNYSTVSKLWKRMGLAVINGERQRKVAGAGAIEQGYCPSRRSVMWTIGDSMFRSGGWYADFCRDRKVFEVEKAKQVGVEVVPSAKIPKGRESEFMSKGHVHNRAKRYMEKRLLRDLWRAWRG